jgi:predicted DsbA family dithiol-disulfide isomerase
MSDGTYIVYGDFNCPFSRLASARLAVLEDRGEPPVEFRAVEHDPSIPGEGIRVVGDVQEELERELAQIREMLGPDERDPLQLPARRLNTRRAIEAYAAVPPEHRPEARERIFAAYWEGDQDISDPAVLADLDVAGSDPETAARWQEGWAALPSIVPVMVLPDGTVSKGLGALVRLGQLAGIV